MKERFRNIPAPLQKQILQRAFGMAIGIVIMIFAGKEDIVLLLPGIAALLMFLVSACSLAIRCLDGNYLILRGQCLQIERSFVRKNIKAIYLKVQNHTVKLRCQIPRRIAVGDQLTIYISNDAPVYEEDGCQVLFHILAIGREHGD